MNQAPLTVLLIEDNPGDARLIRELLAEVPGAPVVLVCVERLHAGLDRLAAGGIDAVLLDLVLPDSRGLDTFTTALGRAQGVPIVVLTSLADEALAVKAVREGAQDYLVKGQVDGHLLTRALRYAIERKQAEEALQRAHDEQERRVQERTAELSKAIGVLEEQIAERKKAEKQLQRSEDQLRSLSSRLLAIQEEERSRIAREIHDELGQALTALKIDLAWVRQRLAVEQVELQTKVQRMTHLVDGMVQAVRRIATALRPAVLDHLGLVAALEWQVREFQERTGLACAFTSSPEDIAVDTARATAVFRICQEALTNVARHAHATRVDLSLRRVGADLYLEVGDDGRGTPEDAIADPKSLGLMGMRERVLPWGGTVQIRRAGGKGTLVTVHVPAGIGEASRRGGLS